MKIINISIQKQKMIVDAPFEVVAGTIGLYGVQVKYDEEWDEIPYKLLMLKGTKTIKLEEKGEVIKVPGEVISKSCFLEFGIIGYDGNGEVRITTYSNYGDNMVVVRSSDWNGNIESDVVEPPTPTIWEDIKREIDGIKSKVDQLEEKVDNLEPSQPGTGGSIAVDSELSVESGNPVQNKVVTQKFAEIDEDIEELKRKTEDLNVTSEDIVDALGYTPAKQEDVSKLSNEIDDLKDESIQRVKSVNGFEPDEDGAVQIRYVADTDEAYEHEGLLNGLKKITIYENDDYTNNPQVIFGKNYYPVMENVSTWVKILNDNHNITVTGTHTASLTLGLKPLGSDDEFIPIPEDFVSGEKLTLCVYGKATDGDFPNVKVEMYDIDKKLITQLTAKILSGETFATRADFSIPKNIAYIRYSLTVYANMAYNHTFYPVLIKSNTQVENVTFVDGEATLETDNATTEICTAPYKSIINCDFDLKKYIDRKSGQTKEENPFKGSILTPEMFGAYADGLHDDTEAVQNCINYAIEKNTKVIGGGEYIISEPIRITANNWSMDLHTIRYSGSDAAIIFNGSRNSIRISAIYAETGVGLRLNSDINSVYNNFYIGYVNSSASNCIEYIATTNNLICNTMTFGYLKAGKDANCIHIGNDYGMDVFLNNNNFIGGKLCGGKWGVYGAKGADTYMTCMFEDVDNCILMNGLGECRVISPRYAEVKMHTDESNGIVFAIESPEERLKYEITKIQQVIIEAHGGYVSPFNVDLRKSAIEVYKEDGSIQPISKSYPGACMVKCELTKEENTHSIAKEFMTFGRHILIKEPTHNLVKRVTVNETGYTGSYWDTGIEDEFDIYSRFIIEASGCDYTLPPSYDEIAFNKFIVEQTDGTSCTFRDWRGTIIFDGAQYGAGIYEVQATIKNGVYYDYYDNRNQVWEIRRMSDYSLVDTMPHAE